MQDKKIIKILFMMLLIVGLPMSIQAEDDYYPVAIWPFEYEDFSDARIFVGQNNKVVRAKANIHLKSATLWFISGKDNKTKLEAQPGTINKVIFSNGDTYYNVENKMCKVISEDTINGNIARLYKATVVDMDDFNKKYRMANMATVDASVLGVGFSDYATAAANNNAMREDMEPLLTVNSFYILKNGETFEARESEILKHLDNKEERKAYRGFTRSAEVMYKSEQSIRNVYEVFILKK